MKKDACFSPYGMSLTIGQLDENNLFTEIQTAKHQIEWYKNNQFIQSSKNRMDCTPSGEYTVKVIHIELNITQELSYTLNLEPIN